jgi:hypothetical protein
MGFFKTLTSTFPHNVVLLQCKGAACIQPTGSLQMLSACVIRGKQHVRIYAPLFIFSWCDVRKGQDTCVYVFAEK